MAQPKKWLSEVMDVLVQLGGKAHYNDIYKLIEQRQVMDLTTNKNWKAAVRQTIEIHSSDSDAFTGKKDIFYSVSGKGKGVWAIRAEYYAAETASVPITIITEEYSHRTNAARGLSTSELKAKIEKQIASKSSQKAKKTKTTTTTFLRDACVAEYAKRIAKGVCQLCKERAPFNDQDGVPYLESHHIVWLSEGGKDTIDNTVALCPNCHRKMHVLNTAEDVDLLQSIAESGK